MPLASRRGLLFALIVSLLLHAALLAGRLPDVFKIKPQPPAPRLDVSIMMPVEAAPEILEKNTIAEEKPVAVETPPPQNRPSTKPLTAKKDEGARRKDNDYELYPKAAREAGLEGTVHLFLKLAPDGTVLDVEVAASSGHLILDNAAVAAMLRAGRINAGGQTSVIKPIQFKLK